MQNHPIAPKSSSDPDHCVSRRTLLAGGLGAGVAAALPACAVATGLDPRVAALVRSTIGIDAHNHVDVPLMEADVPGPAIDLAGEMRRSGLSAIVATFAVDYQPITDQDQGYQRFLAGLAWMDAQLRLNAMSRALTPADLKRAHDRRQPTIIQSVEGCHFLEGRLDRIDEAHGRGLRHLGLLHDSDAAPPLGDVFTNPPRYGGLTDLGREVIRRCNRIGMLVDLAHGSVETVAAALRISSRPLIISHTGLDTRLGDDPSMARMMRPRLIGAALARDVASAGGVIGVWTHLADTPDAYADNVRALVDVVGIDHVCIGTDTKLTPPRAIGAGGPPPGKPPISDRGGPPPGGPRRDGEGGPPPGGRGPRPGGDRTDQLWGAKREGFYYLVVDALLRKQFTPAEIARIGGGNYARVFGESVAG